MTCWRFWTAPIRAEPLAAFRIALGLTVLVYQLTSIGPNLMRYCGPDGICPAEVHDGWLKRSAHISVLRGPVSLPLLGDWLPEEWAKKYPWLNEWVSPEQARVWADWASSPSGTRLLFAVYLGSLLSLTVGFFSRLSAFGALILACSFNHRLAEMMNGGDYLFCNGFYFLILSPCGAVWSIDRALRDRLFRRVPSAEPMMIPPWSVRLMQIQVAVMYLFTGLTKLGDVRIVDGWATGDWVDGTALYWVMNDVAVTRWSYAQLPVPMVVCRLMSWVTLIFEIGFGAFILVRPLRVPVLLLGVALHLGILVSMEIGWFSQVTLCWYLLFVPGDRLSALLSRFRRR